MNKKRKQAPLLSEINVAAIMDTFTYNSFSNEFNIHIIEPDNWEQIFSLNDIDIFFCESVWRGVGRENIVDGHAVENEYRAWAGKIAVKLDAGTKKEETIFEILEYCKKENIPTVFWNKEDPPSFDRFIDVALKFDYIFTTDENCVKKYHYMGHENVNTLLFATQPKMFNPIEQKSRSDKIIFAGSWPSKYRKRCEDMNNIFHKVLDAGYELKIYNRNSEKEDPQFQYPEEYQKYVYPKVEHYQVPQVYKEGKIGININTIQNSNTMFARRIFELMSSNTYVITNYSQGVYDIFRDNVTYLDMEKSFDVTADEIERLCERNLYDVLENHTYTNRFKHILDCINFEYTEDNEHIHVFYNLGESSLDEIKNDFENIQYYYKHCNIITDEPLGDLSFDANVIKTNELEKFHDNFSENDYFIIRNMEENLDDFIVKARLHYQYIDDDVAVGKSDKKYVFETTVDYENIFFNQKNFIKVLENMNKKENKFKVYTI